MMVNVYHSYPSHLFIHDSFSAPPRLSVISYIRPYALFHFEALIRFRIQSLYWLQLNRSGKEIWTQKEKLTQLLFLSSSSFPFIPTITTSSWNFQTAKFRWLLYFCPRARFPPPVWIDPVLRVKNLQSPDYALRTRGWMDRYIQTNLLFP